MLIGGALKSIEIVFYTNAGSKANVAICCEHINDQRQKYQMVFCVKLGYLLCNLVLKLIRWHSVHILAKGRFSLECT